MAFSILAVIIRKAIMDLRSSFTALQSGLTADHSNDIHYDLGRVTSQFEGAMKSMDAMVNVINEVEARLPGKVLSTIQGSINPRKGKVAELVTLMQLAGEYERIIPIAKPIDFIGIGEDSIDFIEVKSGNSQLTKVEKHIEQLITEGKVKFIVVRHSTELSGYGGEANFQGGETQVGN